MNIPENSICIYGETLGKCTYKHENVVNPKLMFNSFDGRSAFAIDEKDLFKNILVLGGAGSGKTNIINQAIYYTLNVREAYQSFNLIFDTKADFINHRSFYKAGDYIIGNSAEFRKRSVAWNIFDEVLLDDGGKVPEIGQPCSYEANAREIATVLFKDRGSKTQPFFANAARDIFANTIIFFIRRYRDNYSVWNSRLNNADLKSFILANGPAEFAKYFELYSDMRGLISYFGDGKSNQSLGVFGELRGMLYDCFNDVFATKPENSSRSFSVRKAVREKRGKSLFIEYDMNVGESMTPMYRLLVDLALKEALGANANGRVNLFLDELKLLPKLTHLQDALNFGRSKKVFVMAGLQNIDQLYSTYGESVSKQILEGFANIIVLKANDYATRDYVCKRFGPNVIGYRYYNKHGEPIDRERDGYTVEHWDQQNLDKGHAIVGLASQPDPFPFHFEIDPYK